MSTYYAYMSTYNIYILNNNIFYKFLLFYDLRNVLMASKKYLWKIRLGNYNKYIWIINIIILYVNYKITKRL